MLAALGGPSGAAPAQSEACDDAGAAAWKALEARGGVVPEIEEDRAQAPPAWWHYPGPRRSAELLAAEARDKEGLYERVDGELAPGDVLVRADGAGACGKMAVVAGQLEGRWMLQDADAEGGAARTSDDVFFADGTALRPEVAAYRVQVHSDSTLGHVRELERDLGHLEATIAERPPLVAQRGHAVVDEKVHDLLDEAWSLGVDPSFELQRHALTGRALALGAALDWPGAAETAAAVLDDVLARAAASTDAGAAAGVARASVDLLAGAPGAAAALAAAASEAPHAPARARYVLGRALMAAGKGADGLGALRAYVAQDPRDARAGRLLATGGKEPALAPRPARDPGLAFTATATHAGVTATTWGFHVDWPVSWRVVNEADAADSGLLIDLATERVLDPQGNAARGAAVVVAQRPDDATARAAFIKNGARTIFPDAKLKTLPPLVPGSHRQSFREVHEGVAHAGEVTTLERGGTLYSIVLNAPAFAYPSLKDEYVAFVKSLTFAPAVTKPAD
jgi:hypothetical protein